LIITLGHVDLSGAGPVISYIFSSSINSGVVAMVGGLIIVPIVSSFTKKQDKAVVDKMFECYSAKVEVEAKSRID